MVEIDLNTALTKARAKSSGETIKEHTDKLLERLKTIKTLYGQEIENICPPRFKNYLWDIAEIVVRYHDYGKLHSPFQKKLLKNGDEPPYDLIDVPEIPHNFLSLCFLNDNVFSNFDDSIKEDIKTVVFQAIGYHHNREIDERLFDKIINNVAPKDLERFDKNLNLKFWSYIDPKNYLKPNDGDLFKLLIITKGLLHRLDYTASSDTEAELNKEDFGDKIKETLESKQYSLNDFQKEVDSNKDKNLILIAPTGKGKSEAGGIYIGDNKGFFVSPLRVSNNTIYDRFSGKPDDSSLKYNYKNVSLLHSTSLFRLMDKLLTGERDQKDDTNIKFEDIFVMEKESRNLSNHITICTADQLFPFVFKYPGFERIYFTLGYSKIVLDEIQMYNPRMLAFIVKGLQVIKELGGKILIMTATFPEFLKEYFKDFEIKYFSDDSVRHNVKIENKNILDDEIINDIISNSKNKKVLVICNTVGRAISIYNKLEEKGKSAKGLLHSRFILKHRNMLESEIMNFAPNKKYQTQNTESGIWITTQIAEVSLDIDFDILYTELSTADSLIQRMGRVNRSGANKIEPNVIICTKDCSGIGNRKPYDETLFENTLNVLNALKEINNNSSFDLSENDKMEIVRNIFNNLDNSNYLEEFKKSIDIIEKIWNIGKLYNPIETLREAQKQFREIFNITVIPKPLYEIKEIKDLLQENKKKLTLSTNKEEKYKALKEIMDYTVSVPFFYIKSKTLTLFFKDIYITDCEYEFDETNKKGKGLEVIDIKEEFAD
ncbi:MAG: CRISPR-associated helicase Cas3' [Hydrogenothermaceae bacterium]